METLLVRSNIQGKTRPTKPQTHAGIEGGHLSLVEVDYQVIGL